MNNENFIIEETDLDLAKEVCKFIDNSELRNRAVGNAVAAKIAAKYFKENDADTESGLHNIARVLSLYEISDIYVQGVYVDVRLCFNDEDLYVPKSHFDLEVFPLAYLFIKMDDELAGGTVTGFALPSSIDTSVEYNGYYKVKESDLVSYYDVECFLVSNYDENLPENWEKLLFDFIDGRDVDKKALFTMLISSKEARLKLKDIACAQNIFNFVSVALQDTHKSVSSPVQNEFSDVLTGGMLEAVPGELEEFSPVEDFGELQELDSVVSIDDLEEFDSQDSDVDFDITLEEPESLESFDEQIEDNTGMVIEGFSSLDSDTEDEITLNNDFELEQTDSFELKLEEPNEVSEEVQSFDEEVPDISFESEDSVTTNVSINDSYDVPSEADDEIVNPEPVVNEEDEEVVDVVETEDSFGVNFEDAESDNIDEGFEYSTKVTPAMGTLEEEESEEDEADADDADDEFLKALSNDEEVETEQAPIAADVPEEDSKSEAIDSEISTLFESQEDIENSDDIEDFSYQQQSLQKKRNVLPLVGILAILGALGYFGYTKFAPQSTVPAKNMQPAPIKSIKSEKVATADSLKDEAMPIETVENINTATKTEEAVAVSIPAIEQNLGASISVSNLSVNWEVPAGYVTNNTAKRYFTKIGKIIQLNLKTELMLLNKPPITNKISVELEFDNANKKFAVSKIIDSSGEETVDNLVKQTVRNVLNMNLKNNMNVFSNLAGNPILVIRL